MCNKKPLQFLTNLIPLFIGITLSFSLGLTEWKGFFLVFILIGLSISIGIFISSAKPTLGRRVSLILIAPVFLLFLGFWEHENLQIEETVVYFVYFVNSGVFTRVLIHFAIAKVFGPLIFGRGYCGWGCYTAALLEWLPIKENNKIPEKFTYVRIPVLILSLLIPFFLIQNGYDYMTAHINLPKADQFIWFLASNAIYYIIGIALAIIFKKKRAFCKVWCPVSLVMKLPTKLSLVKMKPSGEKCIECGRCDKQCPMDIDVKEYIKSGRKVSSSECILCGDCKTNCPVNAIK